MRRSFSKTKCFAAAALLFAALSVSAPAFAQTDTDYVGASPPLVGVTDVGSTRGVEVLGASGFNGVSGVSGVSAAAAESGTQAATGGGLFAFTGADITALLFLATLLGGTGFIIVRKTRAVR